MIKLCKLLDEQGYFDAADALFERIIVSQIMQPSGNANWPIDARVVPYQDDVMKQRDRDWFTQSPPLSTKEYMVLPGADNPDEFKSEGGTSNLSYGKKRTKILSKIHSLLEEYKHENNYEKRMSIKHEIEKLNNMLISGFKSGNYFAQHGPSDVPGPKNIVIDHSSPSMMGIDGFTWENRRDVFDNADDQYKKLLPN